jgi:hypothetical protein
MTLSFYRVNKFILFNSIISNICEPKCNPEIK